MTVLPRRRRLELALATIVLGVVGGLGGAWLMTSTRADEAETERDQAVAVAEANCAQIEKLGWACVEDPAELQGAEGPQGPQGPGPSDAQVYTAVADYLERNPVTSEGPTPAEIAAAVAEYLQDYPPGPTPEQVAAAVATYLTANPPAAGADGQDGEPGPSGPPGPQGETGPAPSAEAIAAEVERFMTENPLPPSCPAGYEFTAATLLTLNGPPLEAVVCAEEPDP